MKLKVENRVYNLDLAEEILFLNNAQAPTTQKQVAHGEVGLMTRIRYPSHTVDFFGKQAERIKEEYLAYLNTFKEGLPFINLDDDGGNQ